MKILIGADIVPTKSNEKAFIQSDTSALVDADLLKVLQKADYRVFNLEVPLTDQEEPIAKCGPNLIAPAASVNGIRALGADFLTLANNHIMDQGVNGLHDTIRMLEQQGIAYAGVGDTPEQAAKPYILEKDGLRVGFYCCAEHEFSIVSEQKPGANPFDPLWSLDHIQDLKKQCDYVIVLYHGGKEHYRYPSPELQKVCRRIADKGADLIICQHSHCIGCKEEWNHATIVYGQGNFLFDEEDNEYWATSLLVSVDLQKEHAEIEFEPLCKNGSKIELANGNRKQDILSDFNIRSGKILENEFIQQKYNEFADSMLMSYCNRSLGKVSRSLIFRVLNKLASGDLRRKCYTGSDVLSLLNAMECEPHRELFVRGLQNIALNKKAGEMK